MARRLTTNQEIAGSIPASINSSVSQSARPFFCFLLTIHDEHILIHLVFDVQHLQATHNSDIIFSSHLRSRLPFHQLRKKLNQQRPVPLDTRRFSNNSDPSPLFAHYPTIRAWVVSKVHANCARRWRMVVHHSNISRPQRQTTKFGQVRLAIVQPAMRILSLLAFSVDDELVAVVVQW